MKKIKKINSKNIKTIVKEHLLDGFTLPEHKIDSIIKEYLHEREGILEDEYPFVDEYELSPKTNEALSDMVDGLSEMLDDLDIIKEKESNVIVFNDVYVDEHLEDIINNMESLINKLKQLTDLKSSEEIE